VNLQMGMDTVHSLQSQETSVHSYARNSYATYAYVLKREFISRNHRQRLESFG
jgi:hypothetical protein